MTSPCICLMIRRGYIGGVETHEDPGYPGYPGRNPGGMVVGCALRGGPQASSRAEWPTVGAQGAMGVYRCSYIVQS